MEKSVSELHGMLKTAEASIKKAPSTVLLVQNKGKGKGKGKRKGDAEVGGTKLAAKPNPPPAKKGCCCCCRDIRACFAHWAYFVFE